MTALLGVVGFVVLFTLPGAWVAFGLRLNDVPFWARALLSVVLSPPVAVLQYYALATAGVPFGTAAILLAVLNLPAAVLVARAARSGVERPAFATAIAGLAALTLPIAAIAPRLLADRMRMWAGHAWMHTDVVYMFANGQRVPEEPWMSGVRLAYPWLAHLYQGLLAALLDAPPALAYIWANLLCLLVVCGFMIGITRELGGGRLASIGSVIWLLFGVNVVGYWGQTLLPGSLVENYPIWGDFRHTPWVWVFSFFNPQPFALACLAALLFLCIRWRPGSLTWRQAALLGAMVAWIGMLYPILLPVVLCVLGARAVLPFVVRETPRWRETVGLAVALVVAVLVVQAFLSFLMSERGDTAPVLLSEAYAARLKVLQAMVVLSPLLVGVAVMCGRLFRRTRTGTMLLIGVAAAAVLLNVVFTIPYWRNEYKYMFPAALCLTPFAAMAYERVTAGWGRWSVALLTLLVVPMGWPLAKKLDAFWSASHVDRLEVDGSGFDLRLAAPAPAARLTDFLRRDTPLASVLVVDSTDVDLTTLTRRQLYVAPAEPAEQPGVWIPARHLLVAIRGYGKERVDGRMEDLAALYAGSDEERDAALNRMLAPGRPLYIVASEARHAGLAAFLGNRSDGAFVYRGDGYAVWGSVPVTTRMTRRVQP